MAGMLTCLEMAEFLHLAAFNVRNFLDVPTERLMLLVEQDAKTLIGHESNGWKELAESTVAEKERLGYVGQISATDPLLRTGELRDSIKGDAELSPDGATGVVGSSDPIALYQEMGTKHIPPRPFLGKAMADCEPAAERLFGGFAVEILTSKGVRL